MKNCLRLLIWLLPNLALLNVYGQINIDYPSSRAIFQRDKNNNATIHIAGNYTKATDRIEARLVALNGGTTTNWAPIQSNQGGFYNGSIAATGGWYELQVRGIKGDQEVGSAKITPVGIGEVFLIAGQSNAQGYLDSGAPGASDDRVSCIKYNSTGQSTLRDYPYPEFAHLDANSDIAPRGTSAWNWGKLGDLLAAKLGVPILFYNVGWYGSAVRNWRESINGTAYSIYVAGLPFEPTGMPYGNIRSVIQRYTPITGLRGVLWLQGEGDNEVNTSTDSYYNDLKLVIETSRNESGKNLSWMVSLTSYSNNLGVDNQVINGQKKVISSVPNVFLGPNTDLVQVPREGGPGGVHFSGDGLVKLAEAWNTQLNEDYFARSEPFSGASPVKITVSCAGNNNLTLSAANAGYSSINWNTGNNTNNIQVGNGTYRVTAKDSKGNVFFSPEIKVSQQIQPAQPSVILEGSNPVCIGNTATLIANTSENVTWNNGVTGNRLSITTGGEYFVTAKNVYGCESSSARTSVAVLNAPLPEKPKISALTSTIFCDGGEVSLQSDSKVTSIWSNGARTGSITVKTSGEFKVQALDALGCYSPVSDPITVKVNPLPAKPNISLNGPSAFCDGGNVMLTSSYDNGNTWNNASVSKSITVTSSGTFVLKQRDSNGCESTSDPVNIKVNPLPAIPAITSLRPTTFCLRDYTTLRSSDAYSYVWSNGSGSKDVEIRQSGDYTVSARDEIGCTSPPSPSVRVVVNPLPPTPLITADGPTTFCADLSVNLQSSAAAGFLWSDGSTSQTIKVTTSGTFSVQTLNEFRCYSDRSNQIGTQTLALPPAPKIEALGVTTFCDGDFVALKASNGDSFLWSTGAVKDSIHVSQSGAYTARVKDLKGCFSPYAPEIRVDVKPTPSAPTIRQTGVYTLIAENNINDGDHVWKLDGAVVDENSATLKAVRSGSYVVNNTVVYSPVLTCFSAYSQPFSFLADTRNNGMVAYPNPLVDGKVTIETLQDVNNATVQVIDSRGIIHKSFTVKKFDSQYVFDISDLPAGIYFLRIVSDSLNVAQKVFVVK